MRTRMTGVDQADNSILTLVVNLYLDVPGQGSDILDYIKVAVSHGWYVSWSHEGSPSPRRTLGFLVILWNGQSLYALCTQSSALSIHGVGKAFLLEIYWKKTSQDKNKTQWVSGSWLMKSLHWISAKSLIRAAQSCGIWLISNSGMSSSRSTH